MHTLGVKTVVAEAWWHEGCLIGENLEEYASKKSQRHRSETVVDSTSAGDSFNGGFLSCYLAGGSVSEACQVMH
ncbi:PfkB family carbohydrate kinase [Vibrio lentus]|nr:PfkB family carbohydrate kinase [Vibrio lentus]